MAGQKFHPMYLCFCAFYFEQAFQNATQKLRSLHNNNFHNNTSIHFLIMQQTPDATRTSPSKVIRRYLGITYAKNKPDPRAIKKYPGTLVRLRQQHFRFPNILTTLLLFSVYSTIIFLLLYAQK